MNVHTTYCKQCGTELNVRIPQEDLKPRAICSNCDYVDYQNPKVVVCCIPRLDDKVLLCKRAIQPGFGMWTIPGGYLESGETLEECAKREAYEEARIDIEVGHVVGIYDVLGADQVHIIMSATVIGAGFAAGHETSDIKLFGWNDIPWGHIAFHSVEKSLRSVQSCTESKNAGLSVFAYRSTRPPRSISRQYW